MKHQKPSLVAIMILLPFLAGCSLFSADQEVVVKTPSSGSIPLSSHSELAGWELVTVGPGGVSRYEVRSAGSWRLTVPREAFTVVLLHPVMEPGGRLDYPAGTVVKPGWTDQEITATWRGGWTADLLYRLVDQGFDIERFQAGRLLTEIENSKLPDPWLIDRTLLEAAFSAGKFNLNALKRVPEHTVKFTGLPPGFALPENPFADPVMIPESGEQTFGLSAGIHRYWLPASGSWLILSVFGDDSGEFTVSPLQKNISGIGWPDE